MRRCRGVGCEHADSTVWPVPSCGPAFCLQMGAMPLIHLLQLGLSSKNQTFPLPRAPHTPPTANFTVPHSPPLLPTHRAAESLAALIYRLAQAPVGFRIWNNPTGPSISPCLALPGLGLTGEAGGVCGGGESLRGPAQRAFVTFDRTRGAEWVGEPRLFIWFQACPLTSR